MLLVSYNKFIILKTQIGRTYSLPAKGSRSTGLGPDHPGKGKATPSEKLCHQEGK